MMLFITLLWIASISSGLILLFNKRFEKVAPMSLILGVILMLFFGLLENVIIGYYISLALVAAIICYLIYTFLKNKNKFNEYKNNLLTTGLFSFVILIIYAYFLSKNLGFSNCDEFTHWGPMVRETFNSGKLFAYSGSEVIARHKDYPPFFYLLECLFCYFGGCFSESTCFFGLFTFMFSLFMPIFDEIKSNKHNIWKVLLIVVGIVLIGITVSITETRSDEARVYNSIYTDWAMGLFTAYGIFFIYRLKEWRTFEFIDMSLIGVTLLLMKQIGIFFYGLIVVYALIRLFLIDKNFNTKLIVKGIVFLTVIPMIIFVAWKLVINSLGLVGQFSIEQLDLLNLYDILKGKTGEEWQREVYRLFKAAILDRKLITAPCEITYFPYLIISSAAIFLVCKTTKEKVALPCIYLIFGLAYAAIMCILYIFSFGYYEGLMLASFDRYMQTFIYLGNCLLFMLTTNTLINKISIKELILFVLLFTLIEWDDLTTLIPKFTVNENNGSNVLVIIDDNSLFEYNRELNNGIQIKCDYLNVNNESFEDFLKIYKDYSWVYLLTNDSDFLNDWNSIVADETWWIGNVYGINDADKFESMYNSYPYFLVHYCFNSR